MPASQHQNPKSDIEISQAAKMTPIAEIARTRLGIPIESLQPYGHYKAKVSMEYVKSLKDRPNGKLILVSAITPTPAGEGKTTTTVGLTDALNKIGKKAMCCLREPSLGPSFGMKGGAAGGGYAQVVPMEDINLHFTGDFHAITSANNLLAALVDNHIYWRNALGCFFARRRRQRVSARGRFRHHGRIGGDGDFLSRQGSRRPESAACENRRGLYPRPQTGARGGLEGAGRHDGAAEGCARAEPRADAGRHPGLCAWRPVCQYRAWLQLGDGHDHRVETGGLRRHRSRLRRRSRRGKIHRHQVPQDRAYARLCGAGRHHPRAEDAWRRQEGRFEIGEPEGAGIRDGLPAAPRGEHTEIRAGAGGVDQPLQRRHRRRNR